MFGPLPIRAVIGLGALVGTQRPRALFVAAFVTTATWLLHRAQFTPGYFHPNGQGPFWTGFDEHAAAYGPGYREMFGALGSERAIFTACSILVATMPIVAFALVRALGGHRRTALVLALAVAFDPVLARVGQSQSYYAMGALLLIAAWALATGSRVSAVAAGLVAAQAARVHPILWAGALLIAFVPRLGRRRGHPWLYLVVLALGSAWAAVAVLSGPVGRHWFARAWWVIVPALALVVAAAWFLRPKRTRLALLLFVPLVDLVHSDGLAFEHAWWLLFLGPLLAMLAQRRRAATLVAAAVLLFGIGERFLLRSPTSALEAERALSWREKLAEHTPLTFVERSNNMIVMLPLDLGRTNRLRQDDRPPALVGYWYRSSLCDTAPAAPLCEAIEKSHRLEPVFEEILPAITSRSDHAYLHPTVRIGLYKVR